MNKIANKAIFLFAQSMNGDPKPFLCPNNQRMTNDRQEGGFSHLDKHKRRDNILYTLAVKARHSMEVLKRLNRMKKQRIRCLKERCIAL